MFNKVLSLLMILLLCSCQQRYWQVKKVKVKQEITVQEKPNKDLPTADNLSIYDSLASTSFESIAEQESRIAELKEEENPIDTLITQPESAISNEVPVVDRVVKQELKNIIPKIEKDSEPLSTEELLYAVCVFILVLMLLALLFTLATVALILLAFTGINPIQLIGLILLLILLYVILAFIIGSHIIRKNINKDINSGLLFLLYLLAISALFLVGRISALLASLSVLVSIALLAFVIIVIVRFNDQNSSNTKSI